MRDPLPAIRQRIAEGYAYDGLSEAVDDVEVLLELFDQCRAVRGVLLRERDELGEIAAHRRQVLEAIQQSVAIGLDEIAGDVLVTTTPGTGVAHA